MNEAHISGKDLKDAGLYVEFDTQKQSVIQVRTGISLVSVANASEICKRRFQISSVGISKLLFRIRKTYGMVYSIAWISERMTVWKSTLLYKCIPCSLP